MSALRDPGLDMKRYTVKYLFICLFFYVNLCPFFFQSIHIGPILEMAVDQTSTLLATGSSDMTIKLWDIDKKYWTHNLKGHKGIITLVH